MLGQCGEPKKRKKTRPTRKRTRMTEWIVECMQVVCASAVALSPLDRNLCKRIPASLATFVAANDKDDDNERRYIKFIRNVNILYLRSLVEMLTSFALLLLSFLFWPLSLAVRSFVGAKRDVNPFRIYFSIPFFHCLCVRGFAWLISSVLCAGIRLTFS